jgi:hypothetical protein
MYINKAIINFKVYAFVDIKNGSKYKKVHVQVKNRASINPCFA